MVINHSNDLIINWSLRTLNEAPLCKKEEETEIQLRKLTYRDLISIYTFDVLHVIKTNYHSIFIRYTHMHLSETLTSNEWDTFDIMKFPLYLGKTEPLSFEIRIPLIIHVENCD